MRELVEELKRAAQEIDGVGNAHTRRGDSGLLEEPPPAHERPTAYILEHLGFNREEDAEVFEEWALEHVADLFGTVPSPLGYLLATALMAGVFYGTLAERDRNLGAASGPKEAPAA